MYVYMCVCVEVNADFFIVQNKVPPVTTLFDKFCFRDTETIQPEKIVTSRADGNRTFELQARRLKK